MQKIFTTGYTGQDINDLKPMLESLDAILVDIRFVPESQILHWRQMYLKILLGKKYRHIPNLGNRTYKEGKITIQNLRLGVETVLNLEINAVLMCVCEKSENCHRRLVIEEFRGRNVETVEIETWKTRDAAVQSSLFFK